MRSDAGRSRVPAVGVRRESRRLVLEFLDRSRPRAGRRLVGAEDDPLQAGVVVDRLEHDERLHRGAVRVGDDAVVGGDRLRVDLGDDERHIRLHPPAGRVVDHDGAVLDEPRRPLLARSMSPRRTARCRCRRGRRHRPGRGRRARRAPCLRNDRGERDDLGGGEGALAKHREHRRAHGAGGADDGDSQA